MDTPADRGVTRTTMESLLSAYNNGKYSRLLHETPVAASAVTPGIGGLYRRLYQMDVRLPSF